MVPISTVQEVLEPQFVLVLAWALGHVVKDVQTAEYLSGALEAGIPSSLLPSLISVRMALLARNHICYSKEIPFSGRGCSNAIVFERGIDHREFAALWYTNAGILYRLALGTLSPPAIHKLGCFNRNLNHTAELPTATSAVCTYSQVLCYVISYACGSTFGTMGIVFPLVGPLAWRLGNGDVDFLHHCFACILGASIFGNVCSPISDTTILTSLASGPVDYR